MSAHHCIGLHRKTERGEREGGREGEKEGEKECRRIRPQTP